MSTGPPYDLERLAELLGLLPPAPDDWTAAASELPRIRRVADQILALAEVDAQFRAALLDDLESALETASFDPENRLVEQLQARLTGRDEPS
jgi:hypothetical protein